MERGGVGVVGVILFCVWNYTGLLDGVGVVWEGVDGVVGGVLLCVSGVMD